MLLNFDQSKDAVWKAVKHELHRGVLDRKHPFRFLTLSTYGDQGVQARWVVLRKVTEDLKFLIYSDSRTQKVRALQSHPQAQLLFYHERKKVQIRCMGEMALHRDNDMSRKQWRDVQGVGKRAYISTLEPGTEIGNPREAHHWSPEWGDRYFTVLEFKPIEFDVLQLNQTEHLRIRFRKKESEWTKTWIAP